MEYINGNRNPADVLSRTPCLDDSLETDQVEQTLKQIIAHAVPRAISLQEVLLESNRDKLFQTVIKCIQLNRWKKQGQLKHFWEVRNELSYKNGLLLRGDKLVIPSKLRDHVLRIAREAHLGITKTKLLLRGKVWWPGVDRQVEELVNGCGVCQVIGGRLPVKEPLMPTAIPKNPWENIHVDIYAPLPDGNCVLGIIDETARWPEVAVLRSMTSTNVIKCLNRVFSSWGYPKMVVSDNGPQFTSDSFKSFLRDIGVQPRMVTTYWPRANGEIEQFFRNIGKVIRGCILQRTNYKEGIQTFLRSYRTTPHSSPGVAPVKLMLGYEPRTKLPVIEKIVTSKHIKQAQGRDQQVKLNMKKIYDKLHHTRVSELKSGDTVLQRQSKKDKFTPMFDQRPFKVITNDLVDNQEHVNAREDRGEGHAQRNGIDDHVQPNREEDRVGHGLL